MATIVLFACGLYVLIFGLLQQTKSVFSSMLYRVLPVLTGAYVVLYAAKGLGWI